MALSSTIDAPSTAGSSSSSSSQVDLEMGERMDSKDATLVEDDITTQSSTTTDRTIAPEEEEEKKIGRVTTRVRNATLESNFSGTTKKSDSDFLSISPTSSTFETRLQRRIARPVTEFRQRKLVARIENYLRGPTPLIPRDEKIKPWFPRTEALVDRLCAPIGQRGYFFIPLFLSLWFVTFVLLVRLSYFTSSTSNGSAQFIAGDSSYWLKDDGCGIDGSGCLPFDNSTLNIRCPGQTLSIQLLNYLDVGAQELIFQPLIVGGFDSLSTYRADTWFCPAAIQHGLFGNRRGGCAVVEKTGSFTGFIGGTQNGVSSVSFPSVFPSTYRFKEGSSQAGCQDLQNDILIMNVILSFFFALIFRPKPAVFYWVMFCLGYWHIALVSDPSAFPPDVQTAFAAFLPTLFVGYGIWKMSWSYTVAAFEKASIERSFWYTAGFWVGVLLNLDTNWIPITQLTPADIAQRPGGLIAVIVLAVVIFLIVANQARVIRQTGALLTYGKWYALGCIIIGLLCTLPGYQFRLHHYFAALVLLPGTAFASRPSALFQSFLLGMFLNGIARWGWDSIIQTFASLVGDGTTGSALPTFITNSTNFVVHQSSVYWNAIPSSLNATYDGFELIVDDVLAYAGSDTNYTITNLTQSIPHYFRIAYTTSGVSNDFTKAATAFVGNGTWINAQSGAGG